MFWFSPLFALLVLIPAVRLLRRGGHSPWSAMLLLIPLVNVGFIWWLAFAKAAERQSTQPQNGPLDHRHHEHAETVKSTSSA